MAMSFAWPKIIKHLCLGPVIRPTTGWPAKLSFCGLSRVKAGCGQDWPTHKMKPLQAESRKLSDIGLKAGATKEYYFIINCLGEFLLFLRNPGNCRLPPLAY